MSLQNLLWEKVVWIEFFRVGENFRVPVNKKREDWCLGSGGQRVVLCDNKI
jgi:hypothetical protein